MLLEGIFLPITTSFHPDGRLFLRKLEANVEHYSRTPAAGMLVLSEVGEAASLTDEETHAVLRSAIQAAAPEKVMIACVGRESVAATLEMAHVAAEAGYDALAIKAPAFAADPAMRPEVATFFNMLADACSLPLLISGAVAVDLLVELAGHSQIAGAILTDPTATELAALRAGTAAVQHEVTVTSVFAAATRRMISASMLAGSNLGGVAVLSAPALKTRSKKVGFQVLTESTTSMLDAWRAGASGSVPRLGPAAPQACCEVWQAHRDGDEALAEEKQDRVRNVSAHLGGAKGIAEIKFGCDFNGYFGGRPRVPLLPLKAELCAVLERDLEGMRH